MMIFLRFRLEKFEKLETLKNIEKYLKECFLKDIIIEKPNRKKKIFPKRCSRKKIEIAKLQEKIL